MSYKYDHLVKSKIAIFIYIMKNLHTCERGDKNKTRNTQQPFSVQ